MPKLMKSILHTAYGPPFGGDVVNPFFMTWHFNCSRGVSVLILKLFLIIVFFKGGVSLKVRNNLLTENRGV